MDIKEKSLDLEKIYSVRLCEKSFETEDIVRLVKSEGGLRAKRINSDGNELDVVHFKYNDFASNLIEKLVSKHSEEDLIITESVNVSSDRIMVCGFEIWIRITETTLFSDVDLVRLMDYFYEHGTLEYRDKDVFSSSGSVENFFVKTEGKIKCNRCYVKFTEPFKISKRMYFDPLRRELCRKHKSGHVKFRFKGGVINSSAFDKPCVDSRALFMRGFKNSENGALLIVPDLMVQQWSEILNMTGTPWCNLSHSNERENHSDHDAKLFMTSFRGLSNQIGFKDTYDRVVIIGFEAFSGKDTQSKRRLSKLKNIKSNVTWGIVGTESMYNDDFNPACLDVFSKYSGTGWYRLSGGVSCFRRELHYERPNVPGIEITEIVRKVELNKFEKYAFRARSDRRGDFVMSTCDKGYRSVVKACACAVLHSSEDIVTFQPIETALETRELWRGIKKY